MEHRIRCATLTGYPQLASSLDLNPADLMSGLGLDIADLTVPDRWIPAAPAVRLLELSARECGRQDFALLLSEYRRFSTLGPISVVIAQEPDLRSALAVLCEHEGTYNGALQMELTEGEPATVRVWLELGEPAPTRQGVELAAAALVGVVRELVRGDWEPLSACFSHPAPADLRTHRRIFGRGLRFDQGFTGLVFPARDLDLPVVTSDPSLRPYARRFLDAVPRPRAETVVDDVRELIEVLLPTGCCSVSQASHALGVTPRTLHRQLAEQQQSFSSLLHETRARSAERLLANDRYLLTEVSQLLGFTAPSAFSRWFRQRFGMSPSEWRDRSRSVVGDPPSRFP
ncbi:MAG: AraC family transcriptional regulator [Kineosporiaceae bacterium]